MEDDEDLAEFLDTPIDALAINTAEYKILQQHPLADTGLKEAFPWLCCCWPEKEKTEKQIEKDEQTDACIRINNQKIQELIKSMKGKYQGRAFTRDAKIIAGLIKEEKKKVEKNNDDGEDDHFNKMASFADQEIDEPTDELGFGIASWMSNLRYLMGVFALLSLFAFYLMNLYKNSGMITGGDYDMIAQMSMGNLGEASTICISQYALLPKTRDFKCKKGTISALKYFGAHTGLENAKLTGSKYEDYPVGNAFCGNPDYLAAADNCASILNDNFKESFEASCLGEASCTLNLGQNFIKPRG